MPRRRYYTVTVTDEEGIKTTYVGKAADEIVQYIFDSELYPEPKRRKASTPRSKV